MRPLVTPLTRAESLPLEDGSVQTTVTSPPYWGQRDYGYASQSGVEGCYADYLDWWRSVMHELHRVTVDSGTAWINIGDTYNTRAAIRPSAHQGGLGHENASIKMSWSDHAKSGLVRYSSRQPGLKDKDLMGLPWRMALIAQEVGWWLRCDVIWRKPWGTSEKADDRPARNHEYLFLFSKSWRNVKSRRTEYMRENRSVWTIAPRREKSGPAAFPDELVMRCLESTSDAGDVVLDPFAGSGTTPRVARQMGRNGIGFDAAPEDVLAKWIPAQKQGTA
jgi:site-specific DNA-methyltransferase (adenine-specific)